MTDLELIGLAVAVFLTLALCEVLVRLDRASKERRYRDKIDAAKASLRHEAERMRR